MSRILFCLEYELTILFIRMHTVTITNVTFSVHLFDPLYCKRCVLDACKVCTVNGPPLSMSSTVCSSLRPSICVSALSLRRLAGSNDDNVKRGCMCLFNLQTESSLSGSSWLAGSTFYVHHEQLNSLYKSILSKCDYFHLFVVFLDCSNELPRIGATHI